MAKKTTKKEIATGIIGGIAGGTLGYLYKDVRGIIPGAALGYALGKKTKLF